MSIRTQKNLQGFSKHHFSIQIGTTRNSQEKDRTAATTNNVSRGNRIIRRKQILKQVNKYELTFIKIYGWKLQNIC